MYRLIIQSIDTGEERIWTITEPTATAIDNSVSVSYGEPMMAQITRTTTKFSNGDEITLDYTDEGGEDAGRSGPPSAESPE